MRRILAFSVVFLLFGCESNEASKKEQILDQPVQTSTPKITIKKGDAPEHSSENFVRYDIDGERRIDFALNDETSDTTRGIVAHARIKSPYESINLSLMQKSLSKNFILKCSACHNDYANGIIGPSLLDKTNTHIADMITKYKFKEKPNALMVQLVSKMDADEIKALADEIYEFNQQFKEK